MSAITEFYSGKTVFVTGATGFMGKVLIEKLVRSLPDIKKIYILVRTKKGFTPQERVKQLADNTIFTFNNMKQNVNEKIEGISGDITKEDFDLSENDKQKLINEVSIVFHIAASVRMNLPLKEAVITNTKSAYQLFKFCMNIKNLKSVVHLSTAFCNVEIKNMEEKVYPIDVDPYKIIDMVEWMDEKSLTAITKKILGPHPNTYTFTKRLSEMIAVDMGDKIPLIITRPSIVIPALWEPTPGWVDNWYGPMGLFIASAKGVVKVYLMDQNNIPPTIPVDIAINTIICSGYERAKTIYSSTPIINVTSEYPFTWREIIQAFRYLELKYPFKHVLWYPGVYITKSYYVFLICSFFFQIIPALVIDFLLIMFLQKPFLITTQKRILQAFQTLHDFTLKKWTFANINCIKLEEKLDKADKETFYGLSVVATESNFKEYSFNSYTAIKKYLVKDLSENYALYRFRNKILYLLDILVKLSFIYIVFKLSFIFVENVL